MLLRGTEHSKRFFTQGAEDSPRPSDLGKWLWLEPEAECAKIQKLFSERELKCTVLLSFPQ
jgi:hypothetical protein